jgi:hypothetical protein
VSVVVVGVVIRMVLVLVRHDAHFLAARNWHLFGWGTGLAFDQSLLSGYRQTHTLQEDKQIEAEPGRMMGYSVLNAHQALMRFHAL